MSLSKRAQLSNVFHNLPAETEPLDAMPQLLLNALEKVCTEEIAEAVLSCSKEMKTCEEIAEAAGRTDVETLRNLLDQAGFIGLLEESYTEDRKGVRYCLAEAFPGLVETLIVNNGTPEAALWLEQYFGSVQLNILPIFPPSRGSMRAIPVRESIDSSSKICSYDELTPWIENSEFFTVTDCSCRLGAKLLGKACEHTYHETCIQIDKLQNPICLPAEHDRLQKQKYMTF